MNNSYLERIAKQRTEKEAETKRQRELEAQLSASKESAKTVADTVAQQSAKTRTSTQKVKIENDDLAKSDDFSQVVDSINKMNMTTFMSTRGFHDMAENITALAESVEELQEGLAKQGLTQVTSSFDGLVGKLESIAKSLTTTSVKVDNEITNAVKSLKSSIDKIDFNPVINVPKPSVTVESAKIDLDPIRKAIENQNVVEEKFDISDYVAQDMDSTNPGFQYVGCMKPNGNWYIVENDVEGSTLRYKFGKIGYKTAWAKRVNTNYKLLNEAVNAISA